MKKILVTITALAITVFASAQQDSVNKKMNPPDFNNTMDGRSQNNSRDSRNQDNSMDGASQNKNNALENRNQNNARINSQNQDMKTRSEKSYQNGVVMHNGKMMVVRNGQMSTLENDMTMTNGTTIRSNGNWTTKGSTKSTMLQEGQHMELSGYLVPMKENKDKKMYLVPDSSRLKDY